MQQQVGKPASKGGWSKDEEAILFAAVEKAQSEGAPLKQVFDRVAFETGRKPNSIRNYYYSQVHQSSENQPSRFVPFQDDEATWLLKEVLIGKSHGKSVRAIVQELSNGDQTVMLRYQNKYRSLLKSQPEKVNEIIAQLEAEGVSCSSPWIVKRGVMPLDQGRELLTNQAESMGDDELARMVETMNRLIGAATAPKRDMQLVVERDKLVVRNDLMRLMLSERENQMEQIAKAGKTMLMKIKEFLGLEHTARTLAMEEFCRELCLEASALENAIEE